MFLIDTGIRDIRGNCERQDYSDTILQRPIIYHMETIEMYSKIRNCEKLLAYYVNLFLRSIIL